MIEAEDRLLLGEKCAVFGVFGFGIEAARITHAGLWALQHRGQESSGISASDGDIIRIHKDIGLVAHVFDEESLDGLKGHLAIGHNRYSTSGSSSIEHAQPVFRNDNFLALAHNGNLPSTTRLEQFFSEKDIDVTGFNDSEMMHEAIRYYLLQNNSLEEAIAKSIPLFTGVYCLLVMTKDKIAAVRDECGIRPFAIGKLNGGFVFASETCALTTVNATYIREVKPGEIVVVDKAGLHSYQLMKGKQRLDLFEFIYFARPDSRILGQSVNEVRRRLGETLAREHQLKADVVIPVPDSAIPAALGFSRVSGIPFDHGLIKNRYIHRTFIRPAQKLRERDVELKLNPLPEVLKGKRVVVIDDSIVRGTTSKKLVAMLYKAGAKKVHLLVSSPPVKFPDFYGINTPNQKELIAAHQSLPAVTEYIGADSVRYLSYEGTINAVGVPEHKLCTSCFTGDYPIDIAENKDHIVYTSPFTGAWA